LSSEGEDAVTNFEVLEGDGLAVIHERIIPRAKTNCLNVLLLLKA
jgi:hypothetical protein